MDSEAFIADFVHEYLSNRNCYDDISDLLDVTIDDFVNYNSFNENKKIVSDYAGDVFDAIKLYELHLGTVDDRYRSSTDKFYT